MKPANKIFLPGTEKQISLFLDSINPENKSVLIIGSGSEELVRIFKQNNASEIYLIIDDEDSLVQSRFLLSKEEDIKIRMMDFTNTDFSPKKFDIIYTQGSTGTKIRNKIIKEIKKIIKPDGSLCVGEIVSLSETTPQFVKDIWEKSNLAPLYKNNLKDFYLSKGFSLVLEQDLSETLDDFYLRSKNLLEETSKDLSEEELKNFRKTAKMYKHETYAYLKLGGNKYIGFKMLILQKVQEQE